MIKELIILGQKYEIKIHNVKDDPILHNNSYQGYTCDLTSDIIIADFFNKESFPDSTDQERINNQNLTLRHEIFHAYLNESGLQSASLTFNGPWARNEEMVDWLAIQSPKIVKTFEEVGCL